MTEDLYVVKKMSIGSRVQKPGVVKANEKACFCENHRACLC